MVMFLHKLFLNNSFAALRTAFASCRFFSNNRILCHTSGFFSRLLKKIFRLFSSFKDEKVLAKISRYNLTKEKLEKGLQLISLVEEARDLDDTFVCLCVTLWLKKKRKREKNERKRLKRIRIEKSGWLEI